MKLYKCDKTILRFSPSGADFLNGYTTHSIEAPRNAFVDLQGKIVAVFDQRKISQDEVWVILEKKFVERVLGHFKKYIFLTDTKIETIGNKNIYWDLDKAEFFVTDELLPAEATREEFTFFRVKNNIPLQGVDFDDEMILNIGQEDLVSYTKGCYLGQEIVARVHYRSKPPKKLVVKTLSECTREEARSMTSKITDPVSGEVSGFVFEVNKA